MKYKIEKDIFQVYFDWAGHCVAMTNYLKKIKVELGNDCENGIQFVSANASKIKDLAPFNGSCQPAWLFMIEGLTKNVF